MKYFDIDNITSSKVCDCEDSDVVIPNKSGSSSGSTRALCESISSWTNFKQIVVNEEVLERQLEAVYDTCRNRALV